MTFRLAFRLPLFARPAGRTAAPGRREPAAARTGAPAPSAGRLLRAGTGPHLPATLAALTLAGCVASTPTAPPASADLPAFLASAEVSRDATTPARTYFGARAQPTEGPALAFGSYARGCLSGAVQLAESGPGWQAMRLSRNRNWGSPQLVAFLERLGAAQARQPGWSGIYVGDMSQPRGGPMSSGHASHQIGLDADIWLTPPASLTLSPSQREALGAISYARVKNTRVSPGWTPAHMALVRSAAQDPAVARIFIFPGAKVQMCKDATGNRDWLRKVRPWFGHTEHIHVRLACPAGMAGCVAQEPPPPGDGCAEAQQWVDNILHPPPPDPHAPKPQPSRVLTLADLPAECSAVALR